ncbi:MAG: hypothetical protein ACOZQL_29780 [Myxococcota bacterium]
MEILVELLLEIVGESLFGLAASVFDGWRPGGAPQPLRMLGFLLVGLLVGWGSVVLFPQHVITGATLRLAWLFVAPAAAATAAASFRRGADGRWPAIHAAVLAATVATWRYFAIT